MILLPFVFLAVGLFWLVKTVVPQHLAPAPVAVERVCPKCRQPLRGAAHTCSEGSPDRA